MKRGRPAKYTSRHRFIVEVLHLHGLSSARIALVMHQFGVPMTDKAVASLVYQLPYRRTGMPLSVRQRLLDRLKAKRIDRNHEQPGLPDAFFTAVET